VVKLVPKTEPAGVTCPQTAITIPAGVDKVSLLGEVLEATTAAGREVATPGRPVAIVSNVQVTPFPLHLRASGD
jgi:hypothetical protein